MSDVTDIRCAVSSGDFVGAASVLSLVSLGSPGTAGTGESALPPCSAELDDSRLFSNDRDRDCERSECESGRGVISDASSKLSCRACGVSTCSYILFDVLFCVRETTHSVLVGALRAGGSVVLLFYIGHGGRCGKPDVQVKGSCSRCSTCVGIRCFAEW